MPRPTRRRTPADWILVGATIMCTAIVALVVIARWLNLLGLWPWP